MNVSNLASSLSRRLSISKFKPHFPQQWKSITANSVAAQQCLTTSKSQCRSITSSKSLQNKISSMARLSLSSWKLQSSLFTHLPKSPNLPITTTFQKRTLATKKHKRIIKMAKGYRGRAKNTFRAAIRRVEKGLQYAYRDRKMKKRNFRKLWIERINAGVRQHGMSYSRFINAMSNMSGSSTGSGEKKIMLNRKVLADLAANEPFSFKAVVDVVKSSSARK